MKTLGTSMLRLLEALRMTAPSPSPFWKPGNVATRLSCPLVLERFVVNERLKEELPAHLAAVADGTVDGPETMHSTAGSLTNSPERHGRAQYSSRLT